MIENKKLLGFRFLFLGLLTFLTLGMDLWLYFIFWMDIYKG